MNRPTVSSVETYRKFSGFPAPTQWRPTVSSVETPAVSSMVTSHSTYGVSSLSEVFESFRGFARSWTGSPAPSGGVPPRLAAVPALAQVKNIKPIGLMAVRA